MSKNGTLSFDPQEIRRARAGHTLDGIALPPELRIAADRLRRTRQAAESRDEKCCAGAASSNDEEETP